MADVRTFRGACALVFILSTAIGCNDGTAASPRDKGTRAMRDAGHEASSQHAGGGGGSSGSNGSGATNAGSGATNAGSGATNAGHDASLDGPGPTDASSRREAGSDGGIYGRCTPVNEESTSYKVGPELADADVNAAFAAISATLNATPSAAPQTFAGTLRAKIAQLPNVGVTGIGRDCTVLVRLTDGTPISVFDDTALNSEPVPDASVDGDVAPPTQLLLGVTGSSVPVALPESGEARIGYIEDFGARAFPRVLAALQKRGYHVSTGMASYDLRDGVKKLGVLWLSTHGTLECDDEAGNRHFCLATDSLDVKNPMNCVLSDPVNCEKNKKDVKQNFRASYFIGKEGSYYAINEDWVSAYWSFSKGSLVFLDGCDTLFNDDQGFVANFIGALVAAKATNYMGWTGPVHPKTSETAVDFFFDRVLGGNKDHLSPTPQRPFSVPEVLNVMRIRRYTQDPKHTGTVLGLVKLDTSAPDAILAPSIQNMTIGDPTVPIAQRVTEQQTGTQLEIDGEFGTAAGTVEIDKTPVDSKWDPGSRKILATLGPTTKGNVVAKVVAGSATLTSNAVPLTSWRGNLHTQDTFVALGPPGPVTNLNCTVLHVRADIHPFRLAPEERPVAGTLNAAGTIDPVVLIRNAVADTTCGGTISGSFSMPVSTTLAQQTKAPIPWIDTSTGAGGTSDKTVWYYLLSAGIDTSIRRVQMGIATKMCTTATAHYGPPVGDVPTPKDAFCEAESLAPPLQPAPITAAPPAQFDPTYSNATLPSTPFMCNGDQCTLDYTLTVEIPSAPTIDTEG